MNSNLQFHEITNGQVVNQVEKFSTKDLDSFIDFSGDSNYLIIGSVSGRVYVYESEGDTPVLEYGQMDEVTCVSGSFDSNYYAFGTDQGLITVLDLSIDFKAWEKDIGGIITEIDFNGDAKYLVAGSTNKKLLLANVTNGDELWRTSAFGDVLSVAMSYRGENIAVGTSAGLAIYYERQLDNQAPVANIESINPTTALPNTPVTMLGSAIDNNQNKSREVHHQTVHQRYQCQIRILQ